MSAEKTFMAAGGLAFAGSFKESKGFPSNGYTIMAATIALVFLSAMVKDTPIARITRAVALLTLLGAAYRYIPSFTTKNAVKKGTR